MDLAKLIRGPIEVEVDSVGRLLLGNWTVSALKKADKFEYLTEGNIRDFMLEFVYSIARKDDPTIEDKKEAYKSGEVIENVNVIPDPELEKIAETYINKTISSMLPYSSDKDEDEKQYLEKVKQLKEKSESESNQDHLRRLVVASLERMKESSKAIYEQFSSLSKKWREPLLNNSLAMSSLNSRINEISSIKIPQLPAFENPTHKTNSLLDNVNTQLDKLTLLTEGEIEQAKLLNEKSSSLLEASAESSEQTKRSIYIATIAIIISTFLTIWSIVETKINNNESSITAHNQLRAFESNNFYIVKEFKEAKDLLESTKTHVSSSKLDNNTQTQQLNSLIKISETLSRIEDNYKLSQSPKK